MSRKVLVFSEPFGMGHERAAQALIDSMKRLEPNVRAVHTNSIRSSFPLAAKHFTRIYLQMINRFPRVWHRFYESGRKNRDNRTSKSLVYRLLAGSIKKAVSDYKPDAVVCTHPFPAAVVSKLKDQGLSIPLAGVITDYDIHAYWLDRNIDMYIVGNEVLRDDFDSFGFLPRSVSGGGIPIDPAFGIKPDKDYIKSKVGLNAKLPVILVAGGGWGLGNLDRIVELLAALPGNNQIIVVAGTNKVMKNNLEARFGRVANVKIFGLAGNMHDLMSAADVMVTKPGGLTTSEGLAAGVPMVLFDVIYGQEEWNSRFLINNGAAVRCACIEDIPGQVSRLIENTGELRLLTERAMALAKPDSGLNAARCVLNLA